MEHIKKQFPAYLREIGFVRDIINVLAYIDSLLKSPEPEEAIEPISSLLFGDEGDRQARRVWTLLLLKRRGTRFVMELIVGRIFGLLFSEGKAVREWFTMNPGDYPPEDRIPYLFDVKISDLDPSVDLGRFITILDYFRNERSRLIGLELSYTTRIYAKTGEYPETEAYEEVSYI